MWLANADCACWLGVLAAGGLLVVVGLLLLVAQNFGGLVFVYLSVISVLSQFLSQFYLSFISVSRRRYFRAFRSYLTPNSRYLTATSKLPRFYPGQRHPPLRATARAAALATTATTSTTATTRTSFSFRLPRRNERGSRFRRAACVVEGGIARRLLSRACSGFSLLWFLEARVSD